MRDLSCPECGKPTKLKGNDFVCENCGVVDSYKFPTEKDLRLEDILRDYTPKKLINEGIKIFVKAKDGVGNGMLKKKYGSTLLFLASMESAYKNYNIPFLLGYFVEEYTKHENRSIYTPSNFHDGINYYGSELRKEVGSVRFKLLKYSEELGIKSTVQMPTYYENCIPIICDLLGLSLKDQEELHFDLIRTYNEGYLTGNWLRSKLRKRFPSNRSELKKLLY